MELPQEINERPHFDVTVLLAAWPQVDKQLSLQAQGLV
jgi:hypothetical protein